MTSPINLSIVIPAMNEEERIGESLRALQQQLPASAGPWEILVVDDGSTIGRLRSSRTPPPRPANRAAAGAASRQGRRASRRAARGARRVRFMCDADLSMPLSELPKFLAVVPSPCDVAIGTREGQGARRVGEPEHRHTMGRVFNFVVRAVRPGGHPGHAVRVQAVQREGRRADRAAADARRLGD